VTLINLAARIRLVEEELIRLYPTDVVQSPLHLSIGQESVAIGVCADLSNEDLLFATYRSHAYYLAKGGDLNSFFAELYGKRTGCCQGKGGSMHLAAKEVGFMGTSAIVASTISHGVGAALALKIRGELGKLVVAVFGDGAADSGVYHECLNFASLHQLPIIFVVEDNGLAVHTGSKERQSFSFLDHAQSYGIETSEIIDSRNPFLVAEHMERVYAGIRKTQKPHLVRICTFRYMEHVGINFDFDAGYRSKEQYDDWISGDPITLALSGENQTDFMSIKQEIGVAVKYAEDSPFPSEIDLFTDVI
jgi:TPP-dependent pyruvate/acetoin dehydrogenase alpha subunit